MPIPRGVDYHAKEVVSRVAHATPGLVAQCVENAALRYGMIKPGFVLPHSTPNGPVPRENGGVGAISRVSTDDSPDIRDDAAQCPEDGHVRPLARVQHQVAQEDYSGNRTATHQPLTGLDYLSSSRALTRAFKCRGWRAPSR